MSSKKALVFNKFFRDWMEDQVSALNAARNYKRFQKISNQRIEFSDLRIRDIAERGELSRYIQAERAVTLMKEQVEVGLHNHERSRTYTTKNHKCTSGAATRRLSANILGTPTRIAPVKLNMLIEREAEPLHTLEERDKVKPQRLRK
jgi:hypothetical protein